MQSMEPVDVPLPPSRLPSQASSRSSSPSRASEASFRSASSSRAPTLRAEYQPVPAKEWFGIYPPVLPPPDFFDPKEVAERNGTMFDKDDPFGPLYDETHNVNLPFDERGDLIVDQESRTRIADVEDEYMILREFDLWVGSAGEKLSPEGRRGQSKEWLEGLHDAVCEDFEAVRTENVAILNEERKKRGLTDWETHADSADFGVNLLQEFPAKPALNLPWRFDYRWVEYQPIPAKEWVGIYPPVLPPPDFFDLEEEEERIKNMFKKDNLDGPLHDETQKVNLPATGKGVLILDPESRTRILDVEYEYQILVDFSEWINSAGEELASRKCNEQSLGWLRGLKDAVAEDREVVRGENVTVLDEERTKRGLTDWFAHIDSDELYALRRDQNPKPASEEDDHESPSETVPSQAEEEEEESADDSSQPASSTPELEPLQDLPSQAPITPSPPNEASPEVPPIDLMTLWW